jgi:D-glycero-alpha-D-manno-heptose 1-phosphate guanylyltransferase
VEAEPLGTGGAIKLGCSHVKGKTVIVLNGDTFFRVNLNNLIRFHEMHDADCTLSLKPMKQFDRYSVVEINNDFTITTFKEKHFYQEGLINGGVYALNASKLLNENLPEKFSFEKEYLESRIGLNKFYGFIQDEYFIDIGIPADFERAQTELISNTLPDV